MLLGRNQHLMRGRKITEKLSPFHFSIDSICLAMLVHLHVRLLFKIPMLGIPFQSKSKRLIF